MDYRSRWYDPELGRFIAPDTIIPNVTNPQSLNRYSYVLNRPIIFNDPTGHMDQDPGGGGCQDYHKCRQEFLTRRSQEILKKLGGKDDAKAMRDIIKVGESLFHNYKDLLPALTQTFDGVYSADVFTLYKAYKADRCAGVGRGIIDCPTNQYTFGDSGFHEDFSDNGNNQIFHVWPYIANVGSSNSFGGAGLSVSQFGNWFHETATSWLSNRTNNGASWNDYFMAQAGMEIGVHVANGEILPSELADFVYWRLGPEGPGSSGMVDSYNQNPGPLFVPSVFP
jgi:hypothetical protein